MSGEQVLVIGAGSVGKRVAALSAQATLASRTPPQGWQGTWKKLDATDSAAVCELARDFDTVILCAAPPLKLWLGEFEPLVRGVLSGLAGSGKTLVFASNLYAYGPPAGVLTESSPTAAPGPKGQLRAKLDRLILEAHGPGLKTAVVRASSFYGPEVTQSILGTQDIAGLPQGRPIDALASVDNPHSVTYIDDFARALLQVAARPAAHGQVWHAPIQTLTLRELAGQFAGQLGTTPRFRVAPPWLVRVHPAMRDLRETLYSYSQPFVASDSKYTAQFGAGTSVEQAVAETLTWMKG